MRRMLVVLALLGTFTTLVVQPPAASAQAPTPETTLGSVRAVATGNTHSCALLVSGQVRCWGDGSYGKLGNDHPTNASSATPVTVLSVTGAGPLTGVTQISLGYNHSCALLANRQVRCWGYNDDGQVGDGTTTTRRRPRVVVNPAGNGPLTRVRQVSAGYSQTCALLTTTQVRCWGANANGGLGNGTTFGHLRPVVVRNDAGTGPLAGVTRVESGQNSVCARHNTGRVRCWGDGQFGQSGNGDFHLDNPLPELVENTAGTGPLSGVGQIQLSDRHACARLASGGAVCWGYGLSDNLGDGNSVNSAVTVAVVA